MLLHLRKKKKAAAKKTKSLRALHYSSTSRRLCLCWTAIIRDKVFHTCSFFLTNNFLEGLATVQGFPRVR